MTRVQAARAGERLADIPILRGNAVELLVDGEATFASILEGIDAAEEYILFQFFIVRDDDLGRKLQSRMFEKDFANSRRMVAADYDDRSFWFKLGVRLSRLTAPIL